LTFALNVYNLYTVGTNLFTNGNETETYNSVSPVDLVNGGPVAVSLNYNGTTLGETLTQGTNQYSTSYAVDLDQILGSGQALVGFTGGTGGGASIQTISDFKFNPQAVPEQSSFVSLGVLLACGLCVYAVSRRNRRRLA